MILYLKSHFNPLINQNLIKFYLYLILLNLHHALFLLIYLIMHQVSPFKHLIFFLNLKLILQIHFSLIIIFIIINQFLLFTFYYSLLIIIIKMFYFMNQPKPFQVIYVILLIYIMNLKILYLFIIINHVINSLFLFLIFHFFMLQILHLIKLFQYH
jgi:hypothetical protein